MSLQRSGTTTLRRSGTRRGAAGAGPPVKQKKGYEVVEQGIRVLHPEPGSSKTTDLDIVFVPGLGAHPVDSWKSKSGFNWASDESGVARDFPTARVLLYMYESSWTGPLKVKQYLKNLAETLLNGLEEKRPPGTTRPIVFIGHSMGGLVIAKAICLAESRQESFPHLFEDIAGCAVFGTPFHGAEAAISASKAAQFFQFFDQTVPSKLLDFMKPDDEGLRELRQDFIRVVTKLSPKIQLFGFYEEQETTLNDLIGVPKGVQITLPKKLAEFVTRESATLDGIMETMGLASNHRELVKFDSAKDERYSLVRGPLKRIIHGALLVAKNRRQATRRVDRSVITKVLETLEGAAVSKKRKAVAKATSTSSWIIEELQQLGWLVQNSDVFDIATARKGADCVWIRGPDGRGKTGAVLAVLEEVDQMMEANQALIDANQSPAPVLLSYFFCENSADFSTAEDLLKSLVRQLVSEHESLAPHAKFLLRKKSKEDSSKGQPQLTVENLWQALQDMLADPDLAGAKIYFVINNLQALPMESASTSTLLDQLRSEIRGNNNDRKALVRWMITSGESYSIGQALNGESVRLVDLEDGKYGDQVQLELRRHAQSKVSALVDEKKYSKALEYFASSLLGRRAQNTQWIDITVVQLKGLPDNDTDLQVRRLLEAMPQELDALLIHAWHQIFDIHRDRVAEIKDLLRVLVLTYENPTLEELRLLVGLPETDLQRERLHGLVDVCKPLLCVDRRGFVYFIEDVVRSHLLNNAHLLLDLSEEDEKLHHGMLSLRSFAHIAEALDFPESEATIQARAALDNNEHLDTIGEEAEDDDADEQDATSRVDGNMNDTAEQDGDGNDDSDSDGAEDYDEESDVSDDEWSDDGYKADKDEDPEAIELIDKALPYAVKHWLHHASNATADIAERLSLEEDFWKGDSQIRRRWLTEYTRLTDAFRYHQRRDLTGLHVAASIGFRLLVAALIKNGHKDELPLRANFYTPLHLASLFGRVNIVEELLNKGAPVNDGEEEYLATPLHMAAAVGNVPIMNKLLERDAKPDAQCGIYGGVINAAIESGNRDAVRVLVEKNVSLESKDDEDDEDDQSKDENDEDGEGAEDDEDDEDEDDDEEEVIREPLALAALRSDLSMFDFLVETYKDKLPQKEFDTAFIKAAGAGRMEVFERLLKDYEHSDEVFQEALEEASYKEQWDVVKQILEARQGLSCDIPLKFTAWATDGSEEHDVIETLWEYSGCSIQPEALDAALYNATDYENLETVRLLLRLGASADATGAEYGNALTAAAYDGTINIIEELLQYKAEINAPDGWALQAAAAEGHDEVVDLLLEKGADVNAITTHKDMPQGTALQAAVEAGNLAVVDKLLEAGANPNLGRGPLTCPIIAATHKGEDEILEKLLQKKAQVNVVGGPEMATPLIYAATYLLQSSIEAILDAGADINLADGAGETALMMAADMDDAESVRFLLDRGADVLLRNNSGYNALQKAVESESSESVEVLVEHVSLIMEALRIAIETGDHAVAAVVRSVETRNQGLDYGDPSTPQVQEAEAITVKTPQSPPTPLTMDRPAQRSPEDPRPAPLNTSYNAAPVIPPLAAGNSWEYGMDPSTFIQFEPLNVRKDSGIKSGATFTIQEVPEPAEIARPAHAPPTATQTPPMGTQSGPIPMAPSVNALQQEYNATRPASPVIKRKPPPTSAPPRGPEQGMEPQPHKIMPYPPPQAQALPTPPYNQYTPPNQDPGRYGPPPGQQSGSPSQNSPQQGPPRQGLPQQGLPQQVSHHQGSPQQGPPQQGPPQQGPPQQGSARPPLRQYQAYQPSTASPPRQQLQPQQTFPGRDNRASFQAMPPNQNNQGLPTSGQLLPPSHPSGHPDPLRMNQQPPPVRPGLQQNNSSGGPPNMSGNGPPQQPGYRPAGNDYEDRPRPLQQRMSFAAPSSSDGYPGDMQHPGLKQRTSFGPGASGGYPGGPGPGQGPAPGQRPPYDPKYEGGPPGQGGPRYGPGPGQGPGPAPGHRPPYDPKYDGGPPGQGGSPRQGGPPGSGGHRYGPGPGQGPGPAPGQRPPHDSKYEGGPPAQAGPRYGPGPGSGPGSAPEESIFAFNATLNGRIRHLEPFAIPCFSAAEGQTDESKNVLCNERKQNYRNSTYRREVAGAYTLEQSTICASDPSSLDQCLLDCDNPENEDAWTNRSCRFGNLPSWYLEVQDSNDVLEAFIYARSTGGKLSIKNSGHSYMGDSAQRGSLMLWMRGLRGLSRDTSFIPDGCPRDVTAPVDSITTEAGASCGEAYEFAHSEGLYILCGFSPTVGISGGWVQGAGHSILSNTFGLGVDRVLQFTVVTPDGELRIANRCQNTDLFWALRGGGGGTFGVVLDSTHAVKPAFALAIAEIGIPTNATDLLGQWMELLVDTAIELAEDGWGGHGLGYSIRYVTAELTTIEEAQESLHKLVNFAGLYGGQVKITTRPDWYGFFQDYVLSNPSKAGSMDIISTRVTPAAIFSDNTSRKKLKDYLHERIAEGGLPTYVADGAYLFQPEPDATSLNPGWYNSTWLLAERSVWQWNSTLDEKIDVAEKLLSITERQEAVTPGGATYKNEANPFTPDWQSTWFGENYDALLAIKHKYDPDGLLSCRGCVGWTEEDAQNSCYSAFTGLGQ